MKKELSSIQLVENIPLPMFLANSKKKLQYLNQSILELLLYEKSDLINCDLKILFPISIQEEIEKSLEKLSHAKNFKKIAFKTLAQKQTGSTFPIYLSIVLIEETEKYFLGILKDLSNSQNPESQKENSKFEVIKSLIKEKIRSARSAHLLSEEFCKSITDFFDLDVAWISVWKYNEKFFLRGFFSKNPHIQKESIFNIIMNKNSLSYHYNEKNLKNKEFISIYTYSKNFSELKFLDEKEKIFYLCFPLVFQNKLLGNLNLYKLQNIESFSLNEKVIHTIKEICSDLAYGIVFLENLQNLTLRSKALTKTTNIFHEVVNNFPNGAITVMDKDMIILFAGGDSYLQFYKNTSFLLGKEWNDLFYQTIPKENIYDLKQGKRQFLKINLNHSIFEIDLVPLLNNQKEITGYIHIARDITELEQAKQKAEQASIAKEKFLANISHELRTPLNGIIGLTGLLLETKLLNEQRKYAEAIRASSEHLHMLINELLDYSKIESGKLELEEYEVNIEKIISDVVSIVFSQVKAKRIELLYEIQENIPETIFTDGERLRQILLNLIGNAIKFTERGEVRVIVSKNEKQDIQSSLFPLKIAIKDTGIGIEKEKLKDIFKPFTQADSSIHTRYGGTGLGLSISNRLVKKLGGTLEVESELGKGSTFSFCIHTKFSEITQSQKLSEIHEPVLLLEEDESYAKYILRELNKFCAQVKLETNKNNFLSTVNNFSSGLVILYQKTFHSLSFYIHLIEAIYYYRNLKLIFITHESKDYDYFLKLSESSCIILEKPIILTDLKKALRKLLGLRESIKKDYLKLDSQLSKHYPLSILVVEDNYVNQYMIKSCLNNMGYLPDMASNGLEAVRMAKQKSYDIIFMDMYMPEMDGLIASKKIMDDINIPKKPVIIAVTANVYEADKEACFKAGMKDFLGKPIQIYDFQAKLIKWAKEILKIMGNEQKNEFYELIDETIIKELDTIPDPSGSRLFISLYQLFLKNSPITLEQLKLAIESQNLEEIKQQAHKLKGMSSNLGGKKLAALLKEIELNHTNFPFIKSKWTELISIYEKTKELLQWVSEHKPGEFP